MQAMFDDVRTKLKRGKTVLSNTVTCSMGESKVARTYPTFSALSAGKCGELPELPRRVFGTCAGFAVFEQRLDAATQEVVDMNLYRLGGTPGAISMQSEGN